MKRVKFAPDDPRHGTPDQPQTMVRAGCSCAHCEHRRTVMRRRAKQVQQGNRRWVEPDATIAHANKLIARGWNAEHIAREAQIGVATLSEILRGLRTKIHTQTEAAVLKVNGPPVGYYMPAEPTKRRIRALCALGWSMWEIESRAGRAVGYCRTLIGRNDLVLSDAAAEIARVYTELHMTFPPESPGTAACRAKARNKGWPPPMAWDDIDDLTEVPKGSLREQPLVSSDDIDPVVVERLLSGRNIPSTAAEKRAAMTRHLAAGGSEAEMCKRMGWRSGRYLPLEMKEAG